MERTCPVSVLRRKLEVDEFESGSFEFSTIASDWLLASPYNSELLGANFWAKLTMQIAAA